MKQGHVRALALIALVGSWLFTVDWLVAPLWQDHYRPLDQGVSEMGGNTANLPWLMNAGLLAWGASMLAVAAAVWTALPRGRWRPAIVTALAVGGLAAAVAALAPVDCSASVSHACYERWAAGSASWHDHAHDWAALVVGYALALSSLAVAALIRRRALALVPLLGGVAGLAWQTLGLVVDPSFDPHSHYGAYQRIWLLMATGWIQLLAAAVLIQMEARRRASPAWASAAPPRWSAGRPTQPSA